MPALDQERREIDAEFNRIVGTNVLTFRSRQGITQTGLADYAEMHKSTLNRVETGHRGLKLREALNIADALGVQVETLTRRNRGVRYPV
jgi:transcriptional regulator with XRE-family HTH domain